MRLLSIDIIFGFWFVVVVVAYVWTNKHSDESTYGYTWICVYVGFWMVHANQYMQIVIVNSIIVTVVAKVIQNIDDESKHPDSHEKKWHKKVIFFEFQRIYFVHF